MFYSFGNISKTLINKANLAINQSYKYLLCSQTISLHHEQHRPQLLTPQMRINPHLKIVPKICIIYSHLTNMCQMCHKKTNKTKKLHNTQLFYEQIKDFISSVGNQWAYGSHRLASDVTLHSLTHGCWVFGLFIGFTHKYLSYPVFIVSIKNYKQRLQILNQ